MATHFIVTGQRETVRIASFTRSALLVVLLAAIMSCSAGKESRQNAEFCRALVQVFSEIHSKRTQKNPGAYEAMYSLRDAIQNARLIIKPWEEDTHPLRKQAINYLNASFGDLQAALDLALRSPLDEKEAAEFKVKFDAGLEKLYQTALIVMHPKTGLRLSSTDRKEIADFANRVFEKELRDFRSKIKNEGASPAGWEVFAAAVLSGDYPK